MKFTGLIFLALPLAAASVTLTPSASSPAALGTVVTFQANVGDSGATYFYRFRTRRVVPTLVRSENAARVRAVKFGYRTEEVGYRTVVDYGPRSSFTWTTIQNEGPYEIEVSARNNSTGEVAQESTVFEFRKLATDGPVVTPTGHPLVFLYSAPACPDGGRMRVRFVAANGSGLAQQTPWQACDGTSTMNWYLAGMRAGTAYVATHTLELGAAAVDGPTVAFTTGAVTVQLPAAAPLTTPVPEYGGILWQSVTNARPMATDLNGNVLWYGSRTWSVNTRVVAGGTMLGIFEAGSLGPEEQFLREFDLIGIPLAETNAARVSEQLRARGARPITSFHHEAIKLTDGRYLVLAGSEQLMDDVQGEGTVDVLGDTILVLDSNLQLVWYWDSFDHMDPARRAVLDETCAYPASLACSTFYEATKANDWLHGNSLQLAADGSIIYSARHQDWVIKIDFQNGLGTGDILWRLGAGGDFTLADADESAWFSHQHDAFLMPDGQTLILFDNGNTRISRNGDQGASRGQVWRIDEGSRTATPVLNADLKGNSAALGTAQLLSNGNYHFDAGFIVNPATRQFYTQALEVDPSGNIVWGMQINAQEYRSYRLDDLYTPPLP
jgi:arylsulfate sulfotransferase